MDDIEKLNKAHQILDEVISLVASKRKAEALELIRETLEVKKTQSYQWLDRILDEADVHNENEPTKSKDLEFQGKYVFNPDTNKYVFFLKKFGKNIVLEHSLVKSLVSLYSNFDKTPQTLSYLSKKFDIPKKIIQEVLSILDFTHDDIPVLDEELDEDPEKLVNDLLTSKKFAIYQDFQKKDWIETQEKAKKWELFLQGQIHPLKDLLATWEPPRVSLPKRPPVKKNAEEVLLIGLSDLHFGLYSEGEDLFFSDKTWTIDDTKRVVEEYSLRIFNQLGIRSFNKVVICLMGDLIHTFTGQTDKGTDLQAHPIGEKQLNYAFDALSSFVSLMGGVFTNVEIKAVNGNHAYMGDYILGKMLQVAYGHDPRFSFKLSTSRFLTFKIGNNGFVMDHGASSHTKSKLPTQKGPRTGYIQSVFLADKEVRNCPYRYYLVGDQHHLEHQEYNNFELIMFSTPSSGDRYADSSVLINRPRQSCLIFTDNGLSEVLHFYFD